MHSADYAVARCLSVSPSVRHTLVYCWNGWTYHQSFSISFSFFRTKRDGNIPTQTPWRGRRMQEVWKNHDFRPKSRFIAEMMQDKSIVTMEGEEDTAPKLSNGTSLNDLEWPLTLISRSRYCSTSNSTKMVQHRAKLTMQFPTGDT